MSYKSIEVTGKSEDAAIEKALVQLGLERDDVSVEVLERAKSGFLGLKTTPAKIRVTYAAEPDVTEDPVSVTPASVTPVNDDIEIADDHIEDTASVPAPVEEAKVNEDSRMHRAEEFLVGLFEKMQINAVPNVTEGKHGISIELKGEKLGAVIGRRGETLDAIQHLTNYAVNKGMESRVRITIDAEDYRKKREESLVSLAERMAGKATKFRRNFTLEPMNSYERHVIHSALQDYDKVSTHSTGSEPNRRVVIVFEGSQNSSRNNAREWK